MEWARADGSIGTFFGVHSYLAMQSIAHARLRGAAGALAASRWRASRRSARSGSPSPSTAPTPSRWRPRARRDGDDCVLDGAQEVDRQRLDRRRTCSSGPAARTAHVGGYLVEKGTPGFDARVMTGKTALRAVWQAEITLDGVRVPAANRLPGCQRFERRRAGADRHPLHRRLAGARRRARRLRARAGLRAEREQFGQPIAAYQLVQDKLSRMAGRDHGDAAAVPAAERAAERRAADRGDGVAGEDEPRGEGARRSSPTPATSSAATGSCSRTTSPATTPTWRRSSRSRAPTRSSR